MIENCPEADIQLDARRLSSAPKLRSAECYCSRVTLDELLSDAVMAPVLRSAGYEPDEFREMMTEMAWNLVTPSEGGSTNGGVFRQSNQARIVRLSREPTPQ
jgi:hypothetical protein